MDKKIPMTINGYQKLNDELNRLKNTERPSVIQAISRARELGDLSENAEYHAAKERQGFIEARILELENKVNSAEVIDVSKIKGDTIKFGATVTLIDEDTNEQHRYMIVGSDEADIKNGFLPVTSPLARALIGKSVNNNVEVTTPSGMKLYEVKAVEYQ